MADNVNDVSCMFPDIDRNIIMRDLEMTCSSEATINRILDGQLGCGAIIQDHNGSPKLNAEAFKDIQSNVSIFTGYYYWIQIINSIIQYKYLISDKVTCFQFFNSFINSTGTHI